MFKHKLIWLIAILGMFAIVFCHALSILPSSTIKWKIDKGSSRQIRDFLARGGDPNMEFSTGGGTKSTTRPLHYAVRQGNVKICEILLEYGANPNLRDYNKQTALMNVFTYGANAESKNRVFDLLLPLTNLSLQDEGGRTVLHYIALYGNAEQYRRVAEMNPGLANVLDKGGKSPHEMVPWPYK
ncbi:MAG: ankyrin repeat domain-containing protein [Verrucomicrobiota bacterium]